MGDDHFHEEGGARRRTYTGGFDLDDPDCPAARRADNDIRWAEARHAYWQGESAPSICARFGLKLGTFRHKARVAGWRRADQPLNAPRPALADDPDATTLDDRDQSGLAAHAFTQARRAMAVGRPAEAITWLRLHERLMQMPCGWVFEASATEIDAGSDAALETPPLDDFQPRAINQTGLPSEGPRAEPDPHVDEDWVRRLEARMASLQERDEGALRHNSAGRSVSDSSDFSDSVFRESELPATPPGVSPPVMAGPVPAIHNRERKAVDAHRQRPARMESRHKAGNDGW